MMKNFYLLVLVVLISSPTYAADLSIQITNLTRGLYFTPLLVAAHPADMKLFSAGDAASSSLQEMAEGGAIASLSADLAMVSATVVENPAAGLLAPGMSTTTIMNTDDAPDNTRLSVVAMMLPTNDGFIGLNGIVVPSMAGTYVYDVNAYDAGTEANDEIRGSGAPGTPGFPAPGPVDVASGMNGTGVDATIEGYVHIHRGALGDSDATAGLSDMDNTVQRWLNPVARVIVTVN
jgi:hypothetical protein